MRENGFPETARPSSAGTRARGGCLLGLRHMRQVGDLLADAPGGVQARELSSKARLTPQDTHRALCGLVASGKAVRLARGVYMASSRIGSIAARARSPEGGDAALGRAASLTALDIERHLVQPLDMGEFRARAGGSPLAGIVLSSMIASGDVVSHRTAGGRLLMLAGCRTFGRAAGRAAFDEALLERLAPWPSITALSLLVMALRDEVSPNMDRARLRRSLERLAREGRIELLTVYGRDILVRRAAPGPGTAGADRAGRAGDRRFPALSPGAHRGLMPDGHAGPTADFLADLLAADGILAILAAAPDGAGMAALRAALHAGGDLLARSGAGMPKRLERAGLVLAREGRLEIAARGRRLLGWLEDLRETPPESVLRK